MKVSKFAAVGRRLARAGLEYLGFGRNANLCENIVGWAIVRNWYCERIHQPFIVTFKEPTLCMNASSEFQNFLETSRSHGFPGQHLVVIPHARVATSAGFVVLTEGAFVCEDKWRVSNVINHPYYRGEWPIKKVSERAGDWLCAMSFFGSNYNHWFWDELPRIANAIPHLPSDIHFLIAGNSPAFIRESLISIGVSPQQIFMQHYDEESIVERLWFPTPLGDSEWSATAPDVVSTLRSRIWDWANVEANSEKRRIYVSRSNATYRRASNESELKSLLESLSFETVHAEKLSWLEQVRCFSQAEAIVGIHGAGLTNMLFSPPRAVVVELHGPVSRLHYWNMANVCGHRYACVCSEGSSDHETPESDIQVDLIGLRQAVRQFYS